MTGRWAVAAMGRRNYLIEGVSGAGKTSVATELQQRGLHVIHGDRELAYKGDPETGEPMDVALFQGDDTKSPSVTDIISGMSKKFGSLWLIKSTPSPSSVADREIFDAL
ncbi:hypothetical protein At1D1108_12480 [Agrobacterium tumefaciens]|nr:hypothetical protein At1D1108_12480 [Agrobacterium tumefaciens]